MHPCRADRAALAGRSLPPEPPWGTAGPWQSRPTRRGTCAGFRGAAPCAHRIRHHRGPFLGRVHRSSVEGVQGLRSAEVTEDEVSETRYFVVGACGGIQLHPDPLHHHCGAMPRRTYPYPRGWGAPRHARVCRIPGVADRLNGIEPFQRSLNECICLAMQAPFEKFHSAACTSSSNFWVWTTICPASAYSRTSWHGKMESFTAFLLQMTRSLARVALLFILLLHTKGPFPHFLVSLVLACLVCQRMCPSNSPSIRQAVCPCHIRRGGSTNTSRLICRSVFHIEMMLLP